MIENYKTCPIPKRNANRNVLNATFFNSIEDLNQLYLNNNQLTGSIEGISNLINLDKPIPNYFAPISPILLSSVFLLLRYYQFYMYFFYHLYLLKI